MHVCVQHGDGLVALYLASGVWFGKVVSSLFRMHGVGNGSTHL